MLLYNQPEQKYLPGLIKIAKYLYKQKSLLLKLEGILDAGDLGLESLVNFQTLLDGIAAVDDRRVVTIANELSDTTSWHLRIFLCQKH